MKYICCDELEKALGDHRGLYSQTIGSLKSDKMDEVIMYVGGDYTYRKGPIIVQYCPFCGTPRIRLSQADGKDEPKGDKIVFTRVDEPYRITIETHIPEDGFELADIKAITIDGQKIEPVDNSIAIPVLEAMSELTKGLLPAVQHISERQKS